MADSSNNGFLTAPTFSVALRLIGHAQRGETPDETHIQRPGPPPVLEGIQLPQLPAGPGPMSPQRTGSLNTTAGPSVEIRQEDRARFTRIFASAGPAGGLLDGEKAKEIFVKSKLPFDKLGAIWNLADTKARGALDLTDFIIGMYFIQGAMSGNVQNVPPTLPPGLYESAAGGSTGGAPGSPLRAQATGGSAGGQGAWGAMPLSPHATGTRAGSTFGSPGPASAGQTQSFLTAQRTGLAPPAPIGGAGGFWAVTSDEKAKADQFFDGLDTERKGELPGAAVVPFFMQSKLSEATLANVWDLSDITQSGSLTRDEFAVAMHLINAALTGAEVPQELPANLVPPSLRGQKLPEAVNPQQTDTQKDLFSLMDDDDAGPTNLPVSAAAAFAAPVAGAPVAANQTTAPAAAPAPASRSVSSPFDDDFFGGGSGAAPAAAPASSAAATPTASTRAAGAPAQLPGDQSAEYGNKSLQLNSTQKAVDELQSKRSTLETGVAQGASTLAELETRLTTVRSTHETESRLVKDLEARRDKQAVELKTLRDDLISHESELSRLKAEKDEIEQQVMHDREEVRAAKKRMTEVQTELNALKAEVEKLRKEGRQQKGMVAIAKKQLSTAEGEHTKLQNEKSELEAGEPVERDVASSNAAPEAGGLTVPGGADPVAASPAASTRSLNPFDRFKTEQASSVPQSPLGEAAGSGGSHAGLAAGAAAGVAAATAGMGALHLAEGHEHAATQQHDGGDPFGASDRQAAPAAPADDPWGSASSRGGATADPSTQAGQTASFDDAFGDDFAPSQAPTQQPSTANNASFDDAFGNFDEPATSSAAPISAASVPPAAEAAPSTIGTGAVPAPTADDVATDADAVDSDAPRGALEKGKTPIRGDDIDADSSDDEEDDGPEDFEGYQRGNTVTAARPDAASDPVEAAAAQTAFPVADTAAQDTAEDRFPELPADDAATAQARDVEEGAAPINAATSLLPPTTDSGAISSQHTGATDAFVDASSHDTLAGDSGLPESDHLTASGLSAATVPAAAAAAAATAPSTHNVVPGGFDDDFTAVPPASTAATNPPISAGSVDLPPATASTKSLAGSEPEAQQSAASTTSSVKTRRAPPPAPVRSVAQPSATPSLNVASPSAPVAPASSQPQNAFDDFEASFADLGPASNAQSKAAPSNAFSGATGFDDAFDDDGDFDFVPSFDGDNLVNAASNNKKGTASGPGQDDAFANFEDAFEGAGSGNASAAAATAAGAPTSAVGNGSNASSGFSSFEDAFAPSSEGHAAAPAVGAPSLPARGANAGGLAPPASTGAAGGGAESASSPALPDDAAPVRQLAGMGFARHKVIAALEKSNYRVEKALERLLSEA